MAYVAPNSIVELFGDVGLNDNYTDTYHFASENAKNSYFNGLTKVGVSPSPLSYNREHRNEVKLELPISQIYNASYMRFRNTSFENKWFYAFVDNVEYVSNTCTCVHFHIDVMMTWMGTFSLAECFIERQHSVTDVPGDNIVDENLETGDYIVGETGNLAVIGNNYAFIVFQSEAVDATDEDTVEGLLYGGIYSGLHMYFCPTATSVNEHLNALTEAKKYDIVVMIMMLPTNFLPDHILGSDTPASYDRSVSLPTTLNGYTPRNKKLLTYPFSYLSLYNCEGEHADYRWEFFNIDNEIIPPVPGAANFRVHGIAHAQPEIACIPLNYRGSHLHNYSEKITMKKFPMCAWNVDTYKAYLAQAQSDLAVNIGTSAIQTGLGTIIGGATGNYDAQSTEQVGKDAAQSITNSTLHGISNLLATKILHPTMGAISRGQQTSDLMVGMKVKDFYYYKMCLTEEYARIIDSYFDLFGYAQKKRGLPQMSARRYWTYLKTVGCQVEGNIPADDASEIENIINNGIRFWNTPAAIGHYSLYDNSPV